MKYPRFFSLLLFLGLLNGGVVVAEDAEDASAEELMAEEAADEEEDDAEDEDSDEEEDEDEKNQREAVALFLTLLNRNLDAVPVQEDIQELRKKAADGTAEAQLRLAEALYRVAEADSEHADLAEALEWYEKAAEQGNLRACEALIHACREEEGVEFPSEKIVGWYRRLGESGDVDAWMTLAQMYFLGQEIPEDRTESYRCLKQAEKLALESDEAADIGVVESTLAVYHDNGIGTEEDKVAARECLERALATKPSAKAVFLMGLYHADGLGGLQQDDAKAMMYYRDAAIMGDKEAQCNLASGYAMGRGVAKDMACALVWFRASAAQGCAMALLNLGRCYALGDGVERDLTTARGYFAEAAACGSKQAEQYMETIDAAEYGDAEEESAE